MVQKPLDTGATGSPNASPRIGRAGLVDGMQPNDSDDYNFRQLHPPGGELSVCMEDLDEIEEGQNPDDSPSNQSTGQNTTEEPPLPGSVARTDSNGDPFDRQNGPGTHRTIMTDRTPSGGSTGSALTVDRQNSVGTLLGKATDSDSEGESFHRKIGGTNKRWAKAHWYATQESHRRAETQEEQAKKTPQQQQPFNLTKTMGNITQFMFSQPNPAMLDNLEGSGSHTNLGTFAKDKGIAGVAAAAAAAKRRQKEEETAKDKKPGSPLAGITIKPPTRPVPQPATPETPMNISEKGKGKDEHDEALEEYQKQYQKRHEASWVQSNVYLSCVLILTIYILFAEDIYILADPDPSGDITIYSISSACFFFFLIDLIARSILEVGYANSLYFWLDMFAVCSLFPSLLYVISADLFLEDKQGISGLRSGRAASSGSRLARFVRVLQLASRVTQNAKLPGRGVSLDISAMHTQTVSEMAGKIDFHIAVHVIVAIASMLIIMTGLTFLEPQDTVQQLQLQLRALSSCDSTNQEEQLIALRQHALPVLMTGLDSLNKPLVYLSIGGFDLYGSSDDFRDLRSFPKQYILAEVEGLSIGDGMGVLHVADKQSSQALAKTNLILVNCVIFVLAAMAAVMSSSVRRELLRPIERIVDTMDQITKAPLTRNNRKMSLKAGALLPVEHTLQKVGQLLQLGFGEAGAKIISTNLTNGTMDTSTPGRLIHGIFGFCDIRNFTDCTEVLKADIVKLVNIMAKYVHDAVVDNHGAPNKNIGDAFLLIWKPKGDLDIEAVADSALCSYIRIIIDTSRSKTLKKYEERHEIQERMPGYRVKMGFGLHYGWAIEGAIGSKHKIDASYLSPHVNLASRLEAATKQFGAQILLSEDFVGLLSEYAQTQCRLLDRVTVKGSNKPLELFTYDVPSLQCRGGSLPDEISTAEAASTKAFLQSFPPATTEEFRRIWNRAVGHYLGGPDGSKANWRASKALLDTCDQLLPGDGSIKSLQAVIASLADEEGNAPKSWPGYRALTDK